MSPRIFGRAADVQPETETTEATEAETAEPETEDLAAAAERLRAEAVDAQARAERGELEAQAMIAAADEEAARLRSSARQQALAVQAEATAASRQAARLEEQARLVTAAIAEQERGDEAVQRAAGLEAERVQLLEVVADADAKLADLHTNRQQAEAELGAARSAADVDRVGALRSRLAGVDDLAETLERERQQASDRAAAIGDGTGETGEFGALCAAAVARYGKARELLNYAWPDRAEAVQDRAHEELIGILTGNLERMREEAAAKPEPQKIVYL